MSSTSNAQDLLVNVFRPTYRWDSTTGFVPSLTVSNVTEIITGSVQTARLAVTDTNLNTYIGRDAGASATDTASNVGLGYSAMAGAVNSSNNVAVGMFSLDGMSNSDSNVALGARTDITGRGQRNVLIGPNVTMGDGSGNILIGADISAGNVSKRFQLGTLLYGDLSSGYVGINTSTPAAALDISGIVVFRNKVGFQNPNPDYSLDVAGSVFASEQIIGGKGTQSNPMYTFKDTPGSGMYIPVDPSYGTGSFAIAVNQKPAAIFSSNRVNFFQNLDVSGTFSARNIDISAFSVTNGTPGIPSVTFTNDTSTGLYLAASNRLGVTTGGLRRMEVLSNGDVSMGRLVTKDISYSGTIVGTDPMTCNVIGGVTLCNGNVILTGTATNSNLLVPGWIRNTTTAFVLDISSGNISNSLTTRSSNFRASAGTAGAPAYSFASDATTGVHSAGTSQLAFDTAGVQRMVISNGNVGIGKATPVVALEVVGDVSATTYNGPGGTQSAPHYTFSDDRTTGLFFPGANMIGLSAGGTERVRISNSNIGIGTTAPTNALDVSGTLRVIGTAGDLTFTNGTISLAGVPVISSTGVLSNATSTSNSIGGVTLSNTNIAYAGTITGSTAGASNRIGGVTLSNTNIAYAGTITGSTAGASNSIGGVTLSNTNITYAGAITGSTAGASNTIGGVTLSNTVVRVGNGTDSVPTIAFSSDTDTGLYRFGAGTIGVVSGGNAVARLSTASSVFYTGALTTLTLSNRQLLAQNGTAAAPSHSFVVRPDMGLYLAAADQLGVSIGGVVRSTFSNGDFSNSGTITTSNLLAAPGGAPRPAYAFTTDPSSGLDLVGTSYLAFDTSGVQRMCISGTLVGIGTSTPSVQLDVSGPGVQKIQVSGQDAAVNIQDQRIVSPFVLYQNNATYGVYSSNALPFWLYQNNGVRMAISNGNVGINTTNPGVLLDISVTDAIGLRVGNGNTVNGSFFQVGTAYTGYANVDMVGYFTVYRAGTTNRAGSNVYAQLGCEPGGPHYFLSNNVGIGTRSPTQTLDVSGIFRVNSGTNDVMGVMDPMAGNYLRIGAWNQAGATSKNIALNPNGGNVGVGTAAPGAILDVVKSGTGVTSDLRIYAGEGGSPSSTNRSVLRFVVKGAGGGDVQHGLYGDLTGGNYGISVYNDAPAAYVRFDGTNSRVGIGRTDPGYRLDVTSGATTAAAINASTWSRSAVSTSYYGVFNGQVGAAIAWTTCNAINSDIMEVADNNGTYFRPKVSGIYSFNVWLGGTNAGDPITTIDVSTNSAHSAKNVGNTPEIAVGQTVNGYGRAGVSWTGYLPAAAHYYKIKMANLGSIATNAGGGKVYVTFLGEVGVGSAQPW
jgi:hypothetical protein